MWLKTDQWNSLEIIGIFCSFHELDREADWSLIGNLVRNVEHSGVVIQQYINTYGSNYITDVYDIMYKTVLLEDKSQNK
jgi:hypothetical protein